MAASTPRGGYRQKLIVQWVTQVRPDVLAAVDAEVDKKFPLKTRRESANLCQIRYKL